MTAQGDANIEGHQELASSSYGNTTAKNISAFKTSVANNGGYYIARYEASYGTDKKPNSKVSTSYTNQKNLAPTVEGQLWNNISQRDAAEACRNMYDSTYGATSDLMNSYAWDTAAVFILKYSNSIKEVSNARGNTGTKADENCHLHDMLGNCEEYSTETHLDSNSPSSVRSMIFTENYGVTSFRFSYEQFSMAPSYGFRPILYL